MDTYDKKLGEKESRVKEALGPHPVGTTVGAAAGGVAAAAAAGTVAAGPVGTVVGATAGAVAGGVVGRGVAEMVDPKEHEAYWRRKYADRPYVTPGASFDDYGPAYRYGVDSVRRYPGKSFDEAEAEMRKEWNTARGESKLEWDVARHPVRDAWDWVTTDIDHD